MVWGLVAASALPEPVSGLSTSSEVAAGIVMVCATLLGVIGAALRWLKQKLEVRIDELSDHMIQARDAANEAVSEVKNSHTINLRDDLDGKNDEVLGAIRELSGKFEELNLSHEATRGQMSLLILDLDRRIQGRIDGVKHKIETVSRDAEREHSELWEAVNAASREAGGDDD